MEETHKEETENLKKPEVNIYFQENLKLHAQIKKMEESHRKEVEIIKENIEKCEKCKEVQKTQIRRHQIIGNQSLEGFWSIKGEEWESEIFQTPQIAKGYIWESSSHTASLQRRHLFSL